MGWLAEVLLESPVPPGNYLPRRTSRLGMARATLRRGRPLKGMVGAQRLRDLGSAHPLVGATRVVSAESIASELEADIRSVNPPVMQGWMVGALILAAGLALPGLRHAAAAQAGSELLAGATLTVLPFAVAVALIALASAANGGLELRGDRVIVRSWLAAILRLAGRDLGPASEIRARIEGHSLNLTSPMRAVSLSMRFWPPSARQDALDELPIWGVQAPFGERSSRRAQRDRRREEALERRNAEQAARRRRVRR